MKHTFLSLIIFLSVIRLSGQAIPSELPWSESFASAYAQYPLVPHGLLEAVSFVQTRFAHLDETVDSSCTGMPRYMTCMGLIENGKGYFNPTLQVVSQLSGFTTNLIKSSPNTAIHAYAASFQHLLLTYNLADSSLYNQLHLLELLTEIPIQTQWASNDFAFQSFLFEIIRFLNTVEYQTNFGFPNHKIDALTFFGQERFEMLSAGQILISPYSVSDTSGNAWLPAGIKSADYPPALWNPAASCNYSSRNGTAISAVTIHTVQGTYSGCISWFQNCAASVSAHYVLRSSDGQVTQMVLESNKAWHVGTENPYTIGLEHEGYVNNSAWYTPAMYSSSAALVSDITNSGYGINPIRTAWWPWAPTTHYNQSSIPGGCTRIKGHQHYPNQTHTDPGANWDWNKYFMLIHPTPSAQIFNAASGTLTDPGGAGNYADDQRVIYTIAPSAANTVTISFGSFQLENNWDYLFIYDGADIQAPLIGYYTGNANPGVITSSGNAITLEFRSDCATTAPGFELNWTSVSTPPPVSDNTPPTTLIQLSQNWQTHNFDASFLDDDNPGGSGLEKAYYSVADFNASDWRSNANRGFFFDSFDNNTLHSDWTSFTGTWTVANGELIQSDESLSNTNLSAYLRQDLSNRYLYHFSAAIEGGQSNRRAGFHFFADSASLPNRGNGYFIWFRLDDQQLQFYKVTNDAFSLLHTEPISLVPSQWYDFKVIYDRIAGKISVYKDNMLAGSYTDIAPYSSGKFISFRSGNAIWKINHLHIYRSRYANSSTSISVGNCFDCDIRYQNTSPPQHAAKIYSLVADSAGNLSSIASQDVSVDWTPPEPISTISDGAAADIDTTFNGSFLQYNWTAASDPHSGISRYFYAVGDAPGDSNIVAWNDNWIFLSADDILNLNPGTIYYVQVKSENGAGLFSSPSISNGQLYFVDDSSINPETPFQISIFPNPAQSYIHVAINPPTSTTIWLQLLDLQGRIIFDLGNVFLSNQIVLPIPSHIANGTYILSGFLNGYRFAYKTHIQR